MHIFLETPMLPITWSEVTIDLSMNGQPLKHGQMSYAKMKELIENAQSFLLCDVSQPHAEGGAQQRIVFYN